MSGHARKNITPNHFRLPTQSKENTGYSTQGNRNKTYVSKSAKQHIPIDLQDDIALYVKTEIWRDVKFLSTEGEIAEVALDCMKNLSQLHHLLRDVSDEELDQNVANMVNIYGNVITKAINQRRTDVTSALKKAYDKRAESGAKMPTPAELRDVIYRKDMMSRRELIEEAEIDMETASDHAKKDLADVKKVNREARKINAKTDYDREIFKWYWLCLLPAVCSKYRWGENLRRNCPISTGVHINDPSKTLVTHTDEAFVLVTYENCDQRWPYCMECKRNQEKPDKKADRYQTRWCDDSAGQNRFGGWTNEGRARFVRHAKKIALAKKGNHIKVLEDSILAEISKEDPNEDMDESQQNESEFGGAKGKASFLNTDWENISLDDLESDDEDLDANYRKPKKKKTKK